MSDEAKDQRIATIAGALIIARQAGTVLDAQEALEDAKFILYPQPIAADYKAWQSRNGVTPTTREKDQAQAIKRSSDQAIKRQEGMAALARAKAR